MLDGLVTTGRHREDGMQERMRRLVAVNEAGRAMSAILDLEQLLDRILSLAHEVFDFANCAVLLLDPEPNELFILRARGYDPEVVRTFRAAPGQGITGSVLVTGQPVLVEDVAADSRYIRGVVGAHSEIAAPLVVDELVIGVLDAETSTPRSFSREDLEFFTLFAHQAAVAIHNARLHYQVALHAKVLEQRIEQLGGLLGACNLLVDGTSTTEAVEAILHTVQDACSCESCTLLLGGSAEEMRVHSSVGPPLFDTVRCPVDRAVSLLGRALAEGDAVATASLHQDPEPYAGFPTHGALLAAPLLRAGRPCGLLVGYRAVGDPPSEMDLALFAGFAALLALAGDPPTAP